MREPRYSIPSLWQQTEKLSNRNISSVSTMNTRLQNVTHTEIRCLDPEELRKLLSEQNSDVSHSWCPLKARLVGEIKSAPCILGSIYCVVPHVFYCIKWCTHFPSRIKLISFNYSKLGFHSKVCHYLPLSKKSTAIMDKHFEKEGVVLDIMEFLLSDSLNKINNASEIHSQRNISYAFFHWTNV